MDDNFLKILKEELKKQQDKINQSPLEDFNNLSPEDMYNIVYNPFKKECPIQYKSNIGNEVYDDIPFLTLIEYYLNLILRSDEIKLTKTGNLPTIMVKELYGKGLIKEEMIEGGYQKLYKEQDSLSIQNVKIISDLSGLTKKRNNKLSLTAKGKKYLNDSNRAGLFRLIFETYGYNFNLGYHDGYTDESEVQKSLGYTIYLLLKYGKEEREVSFYSKKILKAYPHIKSVFEDSEYSSSEDRFRSCFNIRIMRRFLNWFNLIEIEEEIVSHKIYSNFNIKSKLMNNIFEIQNDKFKFRKGKFIA